MQRSAVSVFCLVVSLLASPMAAADDRGLPNKGDFYVSPGLILNTGPDTRRVGHDDSEFGVGLILGYGLTDRWSLELLGGTVDSDFDIALGSGEDNVDVYSLNVLYQLKSSGAWRPFLLGGVGHSSYDFEDVRSDVSDGNVNAGIGVFRQLSDQIAFRADVRGVHSNRAGGVEPFAFVGLTGFFGNTSGAFAPADADGDGVRNKDDQCPTTPPGRVVDERGCELDGDNDGVVDHDDQCPNTPAGVAVDERGCAPDDDGDGVPNYRDDCPDSAPGARVDERGCYIELEEEVTIDMNIEFDVDKAQIRPDHLSEISRAVDFLRQYPNTQAVIEGHTDSDGASDYNQALSERRAKAVYDYMVQEAEISASRLSWAGYGESQPIESNDTAAGKQRNRRVTAVVSGTHKVIQK